MVQFYGYSRCSTCTKAKKALQAAGVAFDEIDITAEPPPRALLEALLEAGYRLPELFNRSGVQYRELGMKDKLPSMSESEALTLLAGNGRLCKRPIVSDGKRHTVGFVADRFEATWVPPS